MLYEALLAQHKYGHTQTIPGMYEIAIGINARYKREKERELRDSGSNANTKICFKVRATALRPRLHTEGFPLYVHTGPPTQGTSTEYLVNTNHVSIFYVWPRLVF